MNILALITGASSGIGLELARLHAENGGDLILVARREDRLTALKQELETAHGVDVHVIAADLSDPSAADRIYQDVKSKGLVIEYLINNAGFGAHGLFHETDWAVSLSMIQVNAVSLAALTRLFLPDMLERNSGRILNVTSTASLMPGPLQAVYFATKGFAAYLSNALAEEVRGSKVTVTNFMPTATATEFAEASGMSRTRLFDHTATARDVAKDGYYAMRRGELDAFGGMQPLRRIQYWLVGQLPKRTSLRIVRQMQETN
ncbi:MAG: SDR family oxidoreductase [Pseudomonadota bacterium]